MRPVYNLYQMKPDRLPKGARSAWLRTLPDQPPPVADDWMYVGKERHPSKWTMAEMNAKGTCYLEVPSWLSRRTEATADQPAETPSLAEG